MRTYIVNWQEPDAEGSGLEGPGLDGRGWGSGVLGEDTPFTLQPEEITEGRFWSFQEIREHIGKGILTPNFEQEFERYNRWRA